ncbi:HdeD family acid-resistance protein [Psychrobacter lutiphocae]|uniref:HdeD family acid-resistance protein n=1 Tax=Psychrobacter lutiphocae TaxID=540500 RepID=UPI000372E02F|nr:DUF308 domain-containing protein [Psychrobacter lutiphocae]
MSVGVLKALTESVRYWYIPLIVGVLFIATGIYTFMSPETSYLALSVLFSISFIVTGIAEIVFSLSNKEVMDNWGWTLAFGILTLIVGILLFINPALSMTTLPYYVGFLILFRSISAISFSLDLKRYAIGDWSLLLLLGVLGLIFAFVLIWNPVFAGMTLIVWTGLALISSGVFSLYLAWKLRAMNNRVKNIPDELRYKIRLLENEINDNFNR